MELRIFYESIKLYAQAEIAIDIWPKNAQLAGQLWCVFILIASGIYFCVLTLIADMPYALKCWTLIAIHFEENYKKLYVCILYYRYSGKLYYNLNAT